MAKRTKRPKRPKPQRTPLAERLIRAREAKGYPTALLFAQTHGIPPGTYGYHETGGRGFHRKTAIDYAAWLECDLNWLLTGIGPAPGEGEVPRIGNAGAGDEIILISNEDKADPVPAPPGLGKHGACVTVRGDSMSPAYRDGDLLFFDQSAVGVPDAALRHDCVVYLPSGAMFIKTVLKGSRKDRYHLTSYNRTEIKNDVAIQRAAPVLWIKRG